MPTHSLPITRATQIDQKKRSRSLQFNVSIFQYVELYSLSSFSKFFRALEEERRSGYIYFSLYLPFSLALSFFRYLFSSFSHSLIFSLALTLSFLLSHSFAISLALSFFPYLSLSRSLSFPLSHSFPCVSFSQFLSFYLTIRLVKQKSKRVLLLQFQQYGSRARSGCRPQPSRWHPRPSPGCGK